MVAKKKKHAAPPGAREARVRDALVLVFDVLVDPGQHGHGLHAGREDLRRRGGEGSWDAPSLAFDGQTRVEE